MINEAYRIYFIEEHNDARRNQTVEKERNEIFPMIYSDVNGMKRD